MFPKLLYFVWSPPWHLYISYWQIFWHSIWHIFWHPIWHIFWHSIWPLRSGSAHWDLELVVEVRQCPLGSGARGWGPGSAHCDLEVPVEVRQCPLRSATRGWGPAVPTRIWSSRWRSGCAHGIWTARRRRRVRRRRRRRALLKSSNPHLAGGEKDPCLVHNSSSSWPPQIFSLFQRSLKKYKTKHAVHETRQWMTQVACDIIWVSIICQRPSLSMQGHLHRRKRQGWRMWTKFISEIFFHVFGLDLLKLSWPPASCSN